MKDYDAIVIGSGSGGLTAALALARAGRRVIVFEQHYLPGGYSQSFTIKGFRFSPGIHCIGQLGPGGDLRRIYEGLGIANDLVFLELDPDGYDRVFVGEERFDIPAGRHRFIERLKERFPNETEGIDGYMSLVAKMADELRWSAPPDSIGEWALMPARMRTILRHGLMPLSRFLDRFTQDPLLRAILSIQSGDHGMAPSRAPAALHAGLHSYYFDGACYPRGGGQAIPETMVEHIERRGGQVRLSTPVARILVERGRAVGAWLADGTRVHADVVISNADPGVTWGHLVPPQYVGDLLRHRLRHMRYSVSTLSLFLATDMDLRAAGMDSGNVWYSRTPDIDDAYRLAKRRDLSRIGAIPGLFFNVTTLKDPSLRSDGLHTVEAIALASAAAFAKWRRTKPGARPAEYHRLKRHLTARMLDAVDTIVPGLRRHTLMSALGTPLTNMHYVNATEGAIYGAESTVRNLGPFAFPVRTRIPGLFQCGASTLSPGIHGVTTSGLAAAAAALDCRAEDLLTARGQRLRIFPSEDPASWPPELQPAASRAERAAS